MTCYYETLHVMHNMINVVHFYSLIMAKAYKIMPKAIGTQMKFKICKTVADLLTSYQ